MRSCRRPCSHDGLSAGCAAPARPRAPAPVIRSAASRPEISTGGMPTPGVVPQPASTTLSSPRTRLRGRNGPVWANVWASGERGAGGQSRRAAQSAGVTSRDDLDRRRPARSSPGCRARPARAAARRGRRARPAASRAGRASVFGHGASTNSRSRPAGASPGSVAVGRVTSSDGSLISRPSSMISRNVASQAAPKEIVWWARSGRARVAARRAARPRWATSAAAPAAAGRRPSSRCTTGRSGVSTTASHGEPLASARRSRSAVAHRGDPAAAALQPGRPCGRSAISAPAVGGGVGQRLGRPARIPPRGKNTPATVSM